MTTTEKKKLNKEDFMFVKQKGMELIKRPNDINGQMFKIDQLEDCTVCLFDHSAQIFLDRCKNSTFIIGPIKGSIFVRNCENCSISVACSQFRCRDLDNCIIYLYAANDPIIESSKNLKFAPFNVAYPCLQEQAQAAGFDTSVNKWELIFDFTKDENGKNNNFELLDPSQFKLIEKRIEGYDEKPIFVFPYPQRYGGSLDDDAMLSNEKKDDGLMAFDIRTTSQKDAQNKLEENILKQQQQQQQKQQQQEEEDNNLEMFLGGGVSSSTNKQQQQQQQQHVSPKEQFSFQNQFSGQQMMYQQQQQLYQQEENDVDVFGLGANTGQSHQFKSQPNSFAGGFQPMQFGFQNQMEGDDLDEEEKERVFKVEQDNQERMRKLYLKQEEESQNKQKIKEQGSKWMYEWKQERLKQIELSKEHNKQGEINYHENLEHMKQTSNPWERIIDNIEINQSQYVGTCDVSRMRQAIIARKSDITKSGQIKKNNML